MATTTEVSFRKFSREMEEFGKTLLPAQFSLFMRKIAFELLSRVVNKTPVDTGRARGNWQVAVGVIDTSETGSPDKSGDGTINRGLATLGQQRQTGGTIFISNTLPYILPLEYGHSQRQAPRGMLAVSIQEIEMIFQGAT